MESENEMSFDRISSGVSRGLRNFAAGVKNTAGKAASHAGTWISDTFHLKTRTAKFTASLMAVVLGSCLTLFPILGDSDENDGRYDDPVVGCSAAIDEASSGQNGSGSGIDADAMTVENAKKVYSFFKSIGHNDEQIAGILGNWQTESGIDSTKIESYYKNNYEWTDEKDSIFKGISAYTTGTVFPGYAAAGLFINQQAYKAEDGKYYCGLGMLQATGPAAYRMVSLAEGANQNWYDFDWQLAFAYNGYRPGVFEKEAFRKITSVDEATGWVLANYEGVPGHPSLSGRIQFAKDWYSQMKSWTVDKEYADAVLAMAGQLGDTATSQAVHAAKMECLTDKDYGSYDNSSIAAAAVSMAWDTEEQATGNDGTDLYQEVYEAIWGPDTASQFPWTSKSCDIFVSTAVRWSGADDNFHPRGPQTMKAYMMTNSDRWAHITSTDEIKAKGKSMLQPGDIFTAGDDAGNGHIFIYTGNDVIVKIRPDQPASAEMCHASYPNKSGWIMQLDLEGFMNYDGRKYDVFRNIKKESDSAYSHIAPKSRDKLNSVSGPSSMESSSDFEEDGK